jgi:para-nitrobenzyl esterase
LEGNSTGPVVQTGAGPVVRTGSGSVCGRFEDGLAVFRGIPFARPPVGEFRFAAPSPPVPWDGIRDAVAFGPPPPQSALLPTLAPAAPPGTDPDDWLTVNVWSPSPGAAALPVLVWIYGGAYRFGASSQPTYDGARLASHGVVVVTFNYRVGVEGYAQLPGVPANRGLLDAVAALRWVRDNIAEFGGDPGLVTVFGESAGAGSAASLLVMPAARGLIRRAIVQSLPGTFFAPELAADITGAIAAEAGLPATAEAFAAADPGHLAAASDRVRPREHARWGPASHGDVPFSPVVDGEVLPCPPWVALATGTSRDVDLIVGHTRDEYRLFMAFGGIQGKVTEDMAAHALRGLVPGGGEKEYRAAYPGAGPEELYELVYSDWLFRMPSLHLAQAHAAGGGRTFLYELCYPAGALGACHSLDVALVFGTNRELGQFLLGDPPAASAVELGNLMREEWTAFAKTGDPGWPPYSPGRRLTRVYDDPPSVAPYPEEASMHVWDQHRLGVLDLESGLS